MDDVAPFVWKGQYDLKKFKIVMDKKYPTHTIIYSGDIDENGIWGLWSSLNQIPKNISPELLNLIVSQFDLAIKGGFHIWPKKRYRNKNINVALKEEVANKSLKAFTH